MHICMVVCFTTLEKLCLAMAYTYNYHDNIKIRATGNVPILCALHNQFFFYSGTSRFFTCNPIEYYLLHELHSEF